MAAADTTTAAPGEQPSGKPPALVVDHLTRRFGERTAFENVSFSVAQGEVRFVPSARPADQDLLSTPETLRLIGWLS